MKFYVIGLVFNKTKDKVLLVEKKKPEWQAGRWNGIGGKMEGEDSPKFDKSPLQAIRRECEEETGMVGLNWIHCITFTCPGGTVFVYRTFDCMNCHCEVQCNEIHYKQIEIEQLKVWPVNQLPEKLMSNLKWIIPVCLSTIQFPLIVQQNTLGCDG